MWAGQNVSAQDIRDFEGGKVEGGEFFGEGDSDQKEIFPDIPNARVKHPHTDLWPLTDAPQAGGGAGGGCIRR